MWSTALVVVMRGSSRPRSLVGQSEIQGGRAGIAGCVGRGDLERGSNGRWAVETASYAARERKPELDDSRLRRAGGGGVTEDTRESQSLRDTAHHGQSCGHAGGLRQAEFRSQHLSNLRAAGAEHADAWGDDVARCGGGWRARGRGRGWRAGPGERAAGVCLIGVLVAVAVSVDEGGQRVGTRIAAGPAEAGLAVEVEYGAAGGRVGSRDRPAKWAAGQRL